MAIEHGLVFGQPVPLIREHDRRALKPQHIKLVSFFLGQLLVETLP